MRKAFYENILNYLSPFLIYLIKFMEVQSNIMIIYVRVTPFQ
jgi:hypothetical protein